MINKNYVPKIIVREIDNKGNILPLDKVSKGRAPGMMLGVFLKDTMKLVKTYKI